MFDSTNTSGKKVAGVWSHFPRPTREALVYEAPIFPMTLGILRFDGFLICKGQHIKQRFQPKSDF